jgi:hypothetical protein
MAEHNTGEGVVSTKDMPWEVHLLLVLADTDYDSYRVCLDSLIVLRLKQLIGHPTVEFENGQWRIT